MNEKDAACDDFVIVQYIRSYAASFMDNSQRIWLKSLKPKFFRLFTNAR